MNAPAAPRATRPDPAARAAHITSIEQYVDGLALRHFTGARDLTPLWDNVRAGVQNAPPPATLWPNALAGLVLLDAFRAAHGAPVTIVSAYRSPAYNAAVRGERQSHHLAFRAFDVESPVGTPTQWAAWFRAQRGRAFTHAPSGLSFTFRGGIGVYETFVHVDTRGTDADWAG